MTRRQFAVSAFAFPVVAPESGKFEKLANEYIAAGFEAQAEFATASGEHRYDDRLSDNSREARERYLTGQREFQKPANAIQGAEVEVGCGSPECPSRLSGECRAKASDFAQTSCRDSNRTG